MTGSERRTHGVRRCKACLARRARSDERRQQEGKRRNLLPVVHLASRRIVLRTRLVSERANSRSMLCVKTHLKVQQRVCFGQDLGREAEQQKLRLPDLHHASAQSRSAAVRRECKQHAPGRWAAPTRSRGSCAPPGDSRRAQRGSDENSTRISCAFGACIRTLNAPSGADHQQPAESSAARCASAVARTSRSSWAARWARRAARWRRA